MIWWKEREGCVSLMTVHVIFDTTCYEWSGSGSSVDRRWTTNRGWEIKLQVNEKSVRLAQGRAVINVLARDS